MFYLFYFYAKLRREHGMPWPGICFCFCFCFCSNFLRSGFVSLFCDIDMQAWNGVSRPKESCTIWGQWMIPNVSYLRFWMGMVKILHNNDIRTLHEDPKKHRPNGSTSGFENNTQEQYCHAPEHLRDIHLWIGWNVQRNFFGILARRRL